MLVQTIDNPLKAFEEPLRACIVLVHLKIGRAQGHQRVCFETFRERQLSAIHALA